MRKSILFWSLVIVLPLVLGLTIYVLFKPTAIVSKVVIDLLGLAPFKVQGFGGPFDYFIRFYLCDMLWAFSFTALTRLILGERKKHVIISFLVCLITGGMIELLQNQKVIVGTFDIYDILVETIGSVAAIMIIILFKRRTKNEKQNS